MVTVTLLRAGLGVRVKMGALASGAAMPWGEAKWAVKAVSCVTMIVRGLTVSLSFQGVKRYLSVSGMALMTAGSPS